MDKLTSQIARARRRLVLEQFLRIGGWVTFTCLLIGAVVYAALRFWQGASQDQLIYWLAGAAGVGLLLSAIATFVVRRNPLDAAMEIDRRFDLRERVSSTLVLPPQVRDSEVGQALVADAAHKVERIDVADRFRVRAGYPAALPLAAAAVFLLTVFVPNVSEEQAKAAAEKAEVRKLMKRSYRDLKRKLAEREKIAAEKGLEDATEMLDKVKDGIRDLDSDKVERKDALIRINDLAKQIAERRKKLGGSEEMKKKFERLKDLKAGPADKLAKAMREGDFQSAMEEMRDLKDKLSSGELDKDQQQKLAEQLKQMQEKLEQMRREQEEAKQSLKEQIQQKMAAGDLQAAEQLQNQLDQLQQQDEAMARMGQMAQQLAEAADQLQQGNSQQAGEQLDDVLDQLDQMQMELDELEELGEMMDALAQCKSGMCQGAGNSYGRQPGDQPGNGRGLGEGAGQGERPEEETDTDSYDSKVAANLQKGSSVRMGTADGPNRAGRTREAIKQEIQMSVSERAEAMNDQVRLPRDHANHVGEYFERFVDP